MEIKILRNILEANDNAALLIRRGLRERHQIMINFMSSPGSGKTKLLETLIPILKARGKRIGVIEGDMTTSRDAMRLQGNDIPIVQIQTEFFGGDCHLASNVVGGAIEELKQYPLDIILLENVGNLVCPAEFDTGADLNICLLSVTEGEDKPLKYPLMFRNSHVALINKIDLAVAAEADIPLMRKNMLTINPEIKILETSGKKGTGVEALADLILHFVK